VSQREEGRVGGVGGWVGGRRREEGEGGREEGGRRKEGGTRSESNESVSGRISRAQIDGGQFRTRNALGT